MGLDFAVDELFSTGWLAMDTRGCEREANGRSYPGVSRVCDEFTRAGYSLTVQHIQLFDCFRAEWRDASDAAVGAVVGQTEIEAAVYALAQLRRQLAAMPVA